MPEDEEGGEGIAPSSTAESTTAEPKKFKLSRQQENQLAGTTPQRDWKTFVKPLTTAAAMYGGAKWAGADPLTAGIAGAVGGLSQVPGPHQQVLQWALRPFIGDRQPVKPVSSMPTAPTVNAPANPPPS